MWIASKLGYFSIVRKAPNVYHIRGRSKEDIQNIIDAAELWAQVSESIRADYRYRVIVNKVEYARVMDALEDSVDYGNFKDMIHDNKDQKDKSTYYTNIWGEMADYQYKTEPPIPNTYFFRDNVDPFYVKDEVKSGEDYLDRKWAEEEDEPEDFLEYLEKNYPEAAKFYREEYGIDEVIDLTKEEE